jgi:hypothetical protein
MRGRRFAPSGFPADRYDRSDTAGLAGCGQGRHHHRGQADEQSVEGRRSGRSLGSHHGGAIVTWQDTRSGLANADIYAQRVNAAGAVQWAANGVVICAATGNQEYPMITSDGAGGAIIAWQGAPALGNWAVFAQRVDAAGVVQWTVDGVPLCISPSSQNGPAIDADGSGGAVVSWEDSRGGGRDIYAQRVNHAGSVVWAPTGVALCTGGVRQSFPLIAADGVGGAVVAWEDYRSGTSYDIYAQRVDASGTVRWTANGVALSMATGDQRTPTLTTDGAGGAIVTWQDARLGATNNDVYAQRVNATGTVQWLNDGTPICTAVGTQAVPKIVADGVHGAIVTWSDDRSGVSHLYAQCVDAQGRTAYRAPGLVTIGDVPRDQGGWARLAIASSTLDDALEPTYPASGYNVWRRVDDVALVAAVSAARGMAPPVAGLPLKEWNGRRFVSANEPAAASSFPSGTWELLGSFAAYQQSQYTYLASTVADSSATGIPYSVYLVNVHTTTPSVWYASAPGSGYSVDNIPPAMPGGLMAYPNPEPAGLALMWAENSDADFAHYAVYRSTSADFVPAPANRLGTPPTARWLDGSWVWNGGYHYKVAAVDLHDNQSPCATLTPADVAGIDTPLAPDASYLAQNYPNPFNPATRIVFGLKEPASVSLGIHDTAGRLVRTLLIGSRTAGTYSVVWDGRDANGRAVASGVYFCRLVTGELVETREMVLLR